MSNLNQTELQNLKKLIKIQDSSYKKCSNYSSQCEDQQLKQLFTKATQDSLNIKQKLISFLND